MTLPYTFATLPAGNVPASYLDTNYTFLQSQGVQRVTTTGSANAYVLTPADAWATSYSGYSGAMLTVIFHASNTTATTVNVSGLGAVNLYKSVSGSATALSAGDVIAGIPYPIICDGTNFWLINPDRALSSGSLPYTVLANGTAGQLLTWSAAGAIATVATGTSGQVLTSNGAGAAPSFSSVSTSGKLKQVVFNTSSGAYQSTSSTSFTDITSMTATITPTASSSKILIMFCCTARYTSPVGGGGSTSFDLVRTSTSIASWNRGIGLPAASAVMYGIANCFYLDSPGTTSATTYKARFAANDPSTVGGTASIEDSSYAMRNFILMEIGA